MKVPCDTAGLMFGTHQTVRKTDLKHFTQMCIEGILSDPKKGYHLSISQEMIGLIIGKSVSKT